MLHTKFHQNRSSGSWKEDFKSVLPYMGIAAIWSGDKNYVDEFSLICTYKLTFKIWLKMAQWFLRKVSLIFICK